ncbi:DUF4974 domain-containing protein [Puteibacter caeruleilacunae]|nr:DUF4974 domain-containing protein [Puteibacter caeruleilacunae]
MKRFIDFEIIWRFLHGISSEEEEQVLQNWLSEDKSHVQYFEKVSRAVKDGELEDESLADSQVAWGKMKLGNKSRSLFRFKFLAVASVALIAALFVVFNNDEEDMTMTPLAEIQPGIKKATLVLNDGTAHNLENKDTLVIEERGAKIENNHQALSYTEKKQPRLKKQKVEYNTLQVPRGGEYFLTLSDGTRVWMNSESSLRYPVAFVGKKRVVDLQGEAFFEVAHNEKQPFIVRTEGQQIKVLGTSFNVKAYSREANIQTTLAEGRIQLTLDKLNISPVVLTPGKQSNYEKDAGKLTTAEVRVQDVIAWKEGRLVFRDVTMGEMAKELERWYDVEFVFQTPSVRSMKMTANMKRYENIDKILNLLSKTNELKFTAYERKILVE